MAYSKQTLPVVLKALLVLYSIQYNLRQHLQENSLSPIIYLHIYNQSLLVKLDSEGWKFQQK